MKEQIETSGINGSMSSDINSGPETLIFIRHGESFRNMKGGTIFLPDTSGHAQDMLRLMADHGVPLSEKGHSQARLTGLGLKERFGVPDALYCSDSVRTIQTTEAILSAYEPEQTEKIVFSPEKRCRERCLGPIHNMTLDEAREAYGDVEKILHRDSEYEYRPPEGESLADVTVRAKAFLSDAFEKGREHKTIFVVSHFRFIQCVIWALNGMNSEDYDKIFRSDEMHLKNCGIAVYRYDREKKKMVLAEAGTTFYK